MKFDLPRVLVAVQFTMFLILLGIIVLLPFSDPSLLWVAGFIMALAGVGIGLIAIQEHSRLNRRPPSISPRPVAQRQLVTSGLYRKIRHPIYTGVMLAALGLALIHGHILSMLIALAFIPFFTYKSTVEEHYLKQHYANYTEYMHQTGRFFPRLYL